MFIKKEKEIPQEWRPMWVKRDRQERIEWTKKGRKERVKEREKGKEAETLSWLLIVAEGSY